MNGTYAVPWVDRNQRYLVAAVRRIGLLLDKHNLADEERESVDASFELANEELASAAALMSAPPAIEALCSAFQLSPFERDVLLLCAGMELDSSFAARCGAVHGDARKSYPTFSLALAVLPEAHWSALSASGRLRRWRLVEPGAGDALVLSRLRIDERILDFITGLDCLDERLRGLIERWSEPRHLPESQRSIASAIAGVWIDALRAGAPLPVAQLSGKDQPARCSVAAEVCQELGLRLHRIRAFDIPSVPCEREQLARLWEREASLGSGALLVECDGSETPETLRNLLPFLETVRGPVALDRSEPLRLHARQIVRFDVQKPTEPEQKALWHACLGAAPRRMNGALDGIISQFGLGQEGILAATATFSASTDEDPGRALWDICREHARPRLDDLAQRIDPCADWDDLVLSESQVEILREIAVHVRHRFKVHEKWGFARKSRRGMGISALFSGSSGTGKTMAAEVLANELRLDLYRIDLSSVVSKYIGETEKNLRRVFDAAEEGGAILLFDEADALFGKRTEVKDSHDRYANIEVSYLLQRMEAYRGLAVLTTNMKDALDAAFLRRLTFAVQFPFPESEERTRIWRKVFPAGTPVDGLDPARLARLNLAGGNIHNVAINAAFLAAEANEPVRMKHLLRAARGEYAKLERPLTAAEIEGWV